MCHLGARLLVPPFAVELYEPSVSTTLLVDCRACTDFCMVAAYQAKPRNTEIKSVESIMLPDRAYTLYLVRRYNATYLVHPCCSFRGRFFTFFLLFRAAIKRRNSSSSIIHKPTGGSLQPATSLLLCFCLLLLFSEV